MFTLGALAEFWVLVRLDALPGVAPGITLRQAALHYGTVWALAFLFMLGPLRILWPRWRYNGARFR